MLTESFYHQLANYIKSEPENSGSLYLAIGSGRRTWDSNPPVFNRDQRQMQNELFRKPVSQENIQYLDEQDQVTRQETAKISIAVEFLPAEGTGSVRECGLFIDASGRENSGELLVYFTHPRVEKTSESSYERDLKLDLSPSRLVLGGHETRYLGNSNTTELHDLENEKSLCQIDEIRRDRVFYFESVDEALGLGYDYCGHCFGRELSTR